MDSIDLILALTGKLQQAERHIGNLQSEVEIVRDALASSARTPTTPPPSTVIRDLLSGNCSKLAMIKWVKSNGGYSLGDAKKLVEESRFFRNMKDREADAFRDGQRDSEVAASLKTHPSVN